MMDFGARCQIRWYFYEDEGFLASTNPVWLKWVCGVLIGLF